MKDITVLDILNLPIMANARLKAGQNGLSNIVSYVNVLDNYYDDSNPDSTPINYGENFYLTSFFYGIGNEEYIVSLLNHFVDLKASALCIIDEYMSELPQSAYEIADSNQIPIIFIDSSTPYALIISSIMELKMSYHESELHENLVYELVSPQCNANRKSEIILNLNPNFRQYITALYCINTDLAYNKITTISNQIHLLHKTRENKFTFSCPYKEGMLIVCSFNSTDVNSRQEMINQELQLIRRMLPNAITGVSDFLPLNQIDDAIFQATAAALSGSHNINGVTMFNDIGISKLLIKLISNPYLEEYFKGLYNPVLKYDQKYNSNLIETIMVYIESNLDHVKTGKQLHVHVNTVRYRLNKIKELIPYGNSSLDFNQSLYFIYKILKIKSLR